MFILRKHIFIPLLIIFPWSLWLGSAQEKPVRLLFFGDVMVHSPQLAAAYRDSTDTYDFSECFTYIKPYLSGANYCIGNLETTLGSKPYTGYPLFCSPPAIARDLKNAGVDLLCTANNHACDRKLKGIRRTVNLLDSIGIAHTGTYQSAAEKQNASPFIVLCNNIKIGVYNATYGTNGIPVPKPAVVNILDDASVSKEAESYRQSPADINIAFLHWGTEYKDLPLSSQRLTAQRLHRLGFPLVIGSHPHVIEPMYFDTISGTATVYSLGNFISNQRKFRTDGGAMAVVELAFSNGKVQIKSVSYILTWVYKKNISKLKGNTQYRYYILPADEFLFKPDFFSDPSDYKKLVKFVSHARNLLHSYNKNVHEIDFYSTFWWKIFSGI